MVINHTNIVKESAAGFSTLSIADELFRSRVIFFTNEVNPTTCCNLTMQLMRLESESHDPITLIINSPGGDVSSGMAVYDVIREMKSPVHTCIAGLAASMGAILFLAGDVRTMLKNSRMMLHDPSWGGNVNMAGMKPLAVKEDLERLMETREMLASVIAERTGNTLKEVYKITKTDSYMNAEQAMKFGACTGLATFEENQAGSLAVKNLDA